SRAPDRPTARTGSLPVFASPAANRMGRQNRPQPQPATAGIRAGEGGGAGQRGRPRRGRASGPAEQAAGPPQQDREGQRVEEKGAALGNQIFGGRVGETDQDRGKKGPADTA